jgi:hypothetical protein
MCCVLLRIVACCCVVECWCVCVLSCSACVMHVVRMLVNTRRIALYWCISCCSCFVFVFVRVRVRVRVRVVCVCVRS